MKNTKAESGSGVKPGKKTSTKSSTKTNVKSGVKVGKKAGVKTTDKSEKKNSKSAIIEWLIGICIVAGIIGVFFFARNFGFAAYANEPMGDDRNNVIELQVEAGDSISDVAKKLEKEGMIESKAAFCFRSVFSQYNGLLKEGTYRIDETMGTDDILAAITQTGTN